MKPSKKPNSSFGFLSRAARVLSVFVAITCHFFWQRSAIAGGGDTSWMLKAKYGIFMHYQYRILLALALPPIPSFPNPHS